MGSIVQGYSYNIFISYRQNDNRYDGWVTEFVDHLRAELALEYCNRNLCWLKTDPELSDLKYDIRFRDLLEEYFTPNQF